MLEPLLEGRGEDAGRDGTGGDVDDTDGNGGLHGGHLNLEG